MAVIFSVCILVVLLLFRVYSQPYPACSSEVAVHCGDEETFNPSIVCLGADIDDCDQVGLADGSRVLRKIKDGDVVPVFSFFKLDSGIGKAALDAGKYFKCSLQIDPVHLDIYNMVEKECDGSATKIFTMTTGEWITKYNEWLSALQTRRKEEKETKKKELWESKSKKAEEALSAMDILSKSTRTIMYLREWSHKSVQGMKGDCVMHSVNNILNGNYIRNEVMGKVFGAGLKELKMYKGTKEAEEKEAIEKGISSDFYGIYGNKHKTGEADYYESFGRKVVENALNTLNAEEKKLDVDWSADTKGKIEGRAEKGKEYVEYTNFAKFVRLLADLRTNPFRNQLLGLRFIYSASREERHSVGLRFIDHYGEYLKDQKKGKHWLWVQSWMGSQKYLLTDEELARYLIDGFVYDKTTFRKKIFAVTIQKDKYLLPLPHNAILKNSKMLAAYYECIQSLDDRYTVWYSNRYCEREALAIGTKAKREYVNNFYYDNEEEIEDEIERLEILEEMYRLKRLQIDGERQMSRLRKEYYSGSHPYGDRKYFKKSSK